MQYINFDAILKNAAFFRKSVPYSKLCAVVKNDAYGHCAARVARHLADMVDCFAVGSVQEAEEIAGNGKDILVLIPPLSDGEVARAIACGYLLTVDSFATLDRVCAEARRLGRFARVHLKIDSGMSRLGFHVEQIDELCRRLRCAPVAVDGVFSHFYGEDFGPCDRQLTYFTKCCDAIEKQLKTSFTRHIANTAATLLSDKYHLDMVRVGLGLYGYGCDKLVPAKTVQTDVVAVVNVRKRSRVGYGGKYLCQVDGDIAVLRVGYANGLPRALVGSRINIGDSLYPIAAVCMAMTLVDVGQSSGVTVGDVATLLGNGVNCSNDMVSIYELLCNLS